MLNSDNCVVKADSKLATVLGGEGLSVIETGNVVIVVLLDKAQQIKCWCFNFKV